MNDSKQSSTNWGALLIGILFVLTSIFSLQNPLGNLVSIVVFFAISAILRGGFEIFLRNKFKKLTGTKAYMPIILGAINIIAGVYFLFNLGKGVVILPYIFAAWFILDSIVGLFTLDLARAVSKGYFWFSAIINVLGIFLGISLLFDPITSALSLSFIVALYFMSYGINYIVYAFKQ